MKTFLTILITSLVFLTVGTLALLSWQYFNHQELVAANAELSNELAASRNQVSVLTTENQLVSEKVALLQAREDELRARVDSLESAARTVEETAPRPYRVRAFVGSDSVGEAWIVPHNVTRDRESGRYTFEPVLWMDESSKNHFTSYLTNVVERDVYNTEIYQESYPYYYPYYVTTGRRGKPDRPSVKPEQPIAPRPADPVDTSQTDVRARVFAPPLSRVTTRPQVLSTPATSPINARVFAP